VAVILIYLDHQDHVYVFDPGRLQEVWPRGRLLCHGDAQRQLKTHSDMLLAFCCQGWHHWV